jgi:purine-binding chemotaxis protein CheW
MALQQTDAFQDSWLLCRTGRHLCAMPIQNVIETMRVLEIEPLPGAPLCGRGLSIIRGLPIPVVDIAHLLDEQETQARRIVTIKLNGRTVALLFETVLGIRSIAVGSVAALPPLLQGAVSEAVSAIGILDAELLLFLNNARIIPDTLLMALGDAGAAS